MEDDNQIEELAHLRTEVKRRRKALNKLSPGIDMLLKRRGFSVYKKEPGADLLLPAKTHLAAYYKMLHKYSFRILLRDVIKHQELFTLEQVTGYASPSITKEYLGYLLSIRLIRKKAKAYTLAKRTVTSFGLL